MSGLEDQSSQNLESHDGHNKKLLNEFGSIKRRWKGGGTSVHVTALDAVVNVNSFFTVAVFLGLSLTAPNQAVSLVSECSTGKDNQKYLLLFEVLSFSCFLLSTLVAHGMKLFIVFVNARDKDNSTTSNVNGSLLRCGMLISAIGSIVGTVFLVLSMVCIIQLRFGSVHCDDTWADKTIIPMVILVGIGLVVFIVAAIYDFLH